MTGTNPVAICNGDGLCRPASPSPFETDCLRLTSRLDATLLGLLLGGLDALECNRDGGETSPRTVAGDETTMGNLTSAIGREMQLLSTGLRGVCFGGPIRLVSSANEKPRVARGGRGASTTSCAGDWLALRRSSSIPARSPMDVLLRLRRIEEGITAMAVRGVELEARVCYAMVESGWALEARAGYPLRGERLNLQ